jgi:hypothetical protein
MSASPFGLHRLITVHGHHALRRADRHVDARHLPDPSGPRPGGVDHVVGVDLLALARLAVDERVRILARGVFDLDADDLAALDEHVRNLGVGFDPCTVVDRVGRVGHTEPERVDSAIGHSDRPLDVGREVWFDPTGVLGREDFHRDPALPTPLEFRPKVFVAVLGTLDEESASHLDTVSRDPAEHPVLLDTLPRGGLIGNRVASAAVEKPVHAAHREVPRDAAPGGSPADHEDARHVAHVSS